MKLFRWFLKVPTFIFLRFSSVITIRVGEWYTSQELYSHHESSSVTMAFLIFLCFACDFGITATSGHLCFSQNWQGKNWVLNFSWRFRRFSANKSIKQNAETEQARPQLYFAPKIIKIHLVVLENELIEVCMLIPKKCQKRPRVCNAFMHDRLCMCIETLVKVLLMSNTHNKAWHTRDSFWNCFEINMKT